MSARTVIVRLRADISDYQRAMRDASHSTMSVSDASTQVGTGLLAVGVAATAAVGIAISKFADFDQAMSRAQAGTQATGAALGALRQAAIEGGQATQYSATEAAQAITEMGKAGVSTKDILGGGLTGALNLAAAGELAVGQAGEIAATALNQFGLEGKDLPHVADLLAAGAGKAQGSVTDLANALKYVGPISKGLDVSIEETTGVLAEFASKGIISEQAGTSLRGVLLSLTSPSKIAAKAMSDYGISVYDAQGKFIGLEGVAQEMQDHLGGLDNATRNAALGQMFGNEQITAARILYDGGGKAVADWTAKVSDAGFAAKQAAILTDNLRGDLERLGGSVDTVLIQSGSAANDVLRSMTQAAEDAVNAFGSLPDGAQGAALAIGATVGAVTLLGGGLLVLAPRIVETKVALETLGISVKAVKVGLGIAGGALALGVIGLGLYSNAQGEARAKVDALAESLDQQTGALTASTTAWIKDELTKDQSFGSGNTKSMIEASKEMGVSVETITRAYSGQPAAIREATKAAMAWKAETAWGSRENEPQAVRYIKNLGDMSARLKDAKDITKAKLEIDQAATGAQGGLAVATGTTTTALDNEATATDELLKAQQKWRDEMAGLDASFVDFQGGMDALIQKNQDAAQATADSTKSSKDSWKDYYDGFSFNLDQYLADMDAQVAAQSAWETNMVILSGKVSQGALDELARLGPEGAPLVAALVNGSAAELAKFEGQVVEKTTAGTDAFTATLKNAAPIIAAAGAQLGQAAANEIAAKLTAGEITVQQAIDNYHLKNVQVAVDVNTDPAQAALDAWITASNARYGPVRIATGWAGGITKAEGGAISGPGTGTSDSIPAQLSNGEHVLTASDVQKAGGQGAIYRMRGMIQAGALGFAQGGGVTNVRIPVDLDMSGAQSGLNSLLAANVPSTGAGGGTGSSLLALGRLLQSMGFSVTENPLFGGVTAGGHIANSKHYAGRAIDINHGAGTSRAEQSALSSILDLVHAAGLSTMFMVPGHFNHMHAQYDQGGLLPPGYSSVYNGTGSNETIVPAGAGQVVPNGPLDLSDATIGRLATAMLAGAQVVSVRSASAAIQSEASAVRARPRR